APPSPDGGPSGPPPLPSPALAPRRSGLVDQATLTQGVTDLPRGALAHEGAVAAAGQPVVADLGGTGGIEQHQIRTVTHRQPAGGSDSPAVLAAPAGHRQPGAVTAAAVLPHC